MRTFSRVAAVAAFAAGTLGGAAVVAGRSSPTSKVPDGARQSRWDELAPSYFSQVCAGERALGITALRRKLCAYASGRVLEVATGTAANLRYYTPEVDALTLVDSSEAMLKEAASAVFNLAEAAPVDMDVHLDEEDNLAIYLPKPKRAAGVPKTIKSKRRPHVAPLTLRIAGAEALPFETSGFDTVIDTFGLCSYDDPMIALQEMVRVCRPGGKILLLEHGRSNAWSPITWYLNWRAEAHARDWGCWWNRDVHSMVDTLIESGECEVIERETAHLGTVMLVVLRRKGPPGVAIDAAAEARRKKTEALLRKSRAAQ